MAKPIIEGSDRPHIVTVYAHNPMDRPRNKYTVTLTRGTVPVVTKNFNDPSKALLFIERATAEGHELDSGSGTETSMKKIGIDAALKPLESGTRVEVKGHGPGRITCIYAYSANLLVLLDTGRALDCSAFDVTVIR